MDAPERTPILACDAERERSPLHAGTADVHRASLTASVTALVKGD